MTIGTTAGMTIVTAGAMIPVPHVGMIERMIARTIARMTERMSGRVSEKTAVYLAQGQKRKSEAVLGQGRRKPTTGGTEAAPVVVTLATAVAPRAREPSDATGLAPACALAAEIGAVPGPRTATAVIGGNAVVHALAPISEIAAVAMTVTVAKPERRSARRTRSRKRTRNAGLGAAHDRYRVRRALRLASTTPRRRHGSKPRSRNVSKKLRPISLLRRRLGRRACRCLVSTIVALGIDRQT
jgi:hypothetical protein